MPNKLKQQQEEESKSVQKTEEKVDNQRELEACRESRPSCMLWEIKRKGSKYEHTRYENVDYSSNELNIDIAAQLVDRINSLC